MEIVLLAGFLFVLKKEKKTFSRLINKFSLSVKFFFFFFFCSIKKYENFLMWGNIIWYGFYGI